MEEDDAFAQLLQSKEETNTLMIQLLELRVEFMDWMKKHEREYEWIISRGTIGANDSFGWDSQWVLSFLEFVIIHLSKISTSFAFHTTPTFTAHTNHKSSLPSL